MCVHESYLLFSLLNNLGSILTDDLSIIAYLLYKVNKQKNISDRAMVSGVMNEFDLFIFSIIHRLISEVLYMDSSVIIRCE